jgi:SAM-dependent methyltransferase
MSDSTNRSAHAKQQFYNQPEIASAYDELRFGGASGAWVNAREIGLALSLIPPFRRALDLGCGTGRLTRALAQRGPTVGIDTSGAMLSQTQQDVASTFVQGNGFALPFADASFDVVVAVRFVFHFKSVDTLLREVARVVVPRGVIVFDTYMWSPRAWLPLDRARWGGGVFVHPPALIERTARQVGLQLAQREFCFLFSPYAYRRLPFTAVRALARLETHLPARLHSRVFWKLMRAD